MIVGGLLLAILTTLSAEASAAIGDWRSEARRFTGESEQVRARSIERLRADGELNDKLRAAFGTPDQFLAFDVISALRIRELLPALIEYSQRDESGYSYQVMNSLVGPAEAATLRKIYRERLGARETSLASKVGLLDSLSRTSENLGVPRTVQLLSTEAPEVRSAALEYVRSRLLRRGRPEYLPAVRLPLVSQDRLLRIQALYLLSELPAELRIAQPSIFVLAKEICVSDPSLRTERVCE